MNFRRFALRAFLLIPILAAASTAGFAGEISGQVTLSGEPASDVVVSIEGLQVSRQPAQREYIIDHRDLLFVPHVIVVPAGASVKFKNTDGMPCRIYSTSIAGIFVLRLDKDKPLEVTFDRPGVIEVRCAEHGHLYAYVVVKENPYFALTDSKGRYRMPNLPPGTYTIQAWYEGTVLESRKVEVGKDKATIHFQAVRPASQKRDDLSGTNLHMPMPPETCSAGASCEVPATNRRSQE